MRAFRRLYRGSTKFEVRVATGSTLRVYVQLRKRTRGRELVAYTRASTVDGWAHSDSLKGRYSYLPEGDRGELVELPPLRVTPGTRSVWVEIRAWQPQRRIPGRLVRRLVAGAVAVGYAGSGTATTMYGEYLRGQAQ